MSKSVKITDFAQDEKNFNRHQPEGMALLEKSIETVGVIESITVSNDDTIISGNARHEKFIEVMGNVEPIVLEVDGTRPVVLKRADIQSGTKEFHAAALLANTTAKKNINLDIELMQDIAVDLFDIDIVDFGVDVIDFDLSEIDGLSENSLRDRINATGQIQITFLFDKEHRDIIDSYMKRYGKQTLQNELLKIIQNA